MTGPGMQSEPTQDDAKSEPNGGAQRAGRSEASWRKNKLGATLGVGIGLGALVGAAVLVAPGIASSVGTASVDTASVSSTSSAASSGESSLERVDMQAGKQRGNQRGQQQGRGPGAGMGSGGSHNTAVAPGSLGTASEQTAAQLAYLVEEEKLAHDIYVLAGSLYPDRVYTNISRSETQHQSAIQQLLVGYALDDPTANTAAGEFQNPELQQLYDQLAKKVKKSAKDAAEVGVIIENTDIADLKEAIGLSDSAVVTSTMNRLESASQNHLKAFTSLKARS